MSEFSLYSNRKPTIDPAQFNDPIALKTGWEPLTEGGANYLSHKFRQISADRAEFDPSIMGCGVTALILGIGLFMLPFVLIPFLAFCGFISTGEWIGLIFIPIILCPAAFALLILVAGGAAFVNTFRPIVFDQNKGRFWKGYREPAELDNESSCEINHIHAIQLISEFNKKKHDKKTITYYSHEINLVLDSGQRVHVVEHGDLAQMRTDAKLLGIFLSVPVWDVSTQ